MRRIDGKIDGADELLVAGSADVGTPGDFDADDFGAGNRCQGSRIATAKSVFFIVRAV